MTVVASQEEEEVELSTVYVRVHSPHAHVFTIAGLDSRSEDLDSSTTPSVCQTIS